jgi:hypothetical protein
MEFMILPSIGDMFLAVLARCSMATKRNFPGREGFVD